MYSVKELQDFVNNQIVDRSKKLGTNSPVELYTPIQYTLGMGGKRLRPVLLLIGYNMFSAEIRNALPAAIAIEVFHNFTLLHDDIMDKARVRRNRPTVHVKFSENNAILSGDAMAFLSYQYLLECQSERMLDVLELFSKTAIEVCEGQQFDMDFENRLDVIQDEYLEMIRLKTAVLLACALKAGALLGNAPDEAANQLYNFGINLGWAFQLQDDLLDTFGDEKVFGKKIGGDILSNKKTFLLIHALDKASEAQKQELLNWINKVEFDPKTKIRSVKNIYNETNVHEATSEKIDFYFNTAIDLLDKTPLTDDVKQPLKNLAYQMLKRNH